MRRLFTRAEALRDGITDEALAWGAHAGKWVRVEQGVYAEGASPPTRFVRALAIALVTGGTACGSLAGTLHDLDSPGSSLPYALVPRGAGADRPEVRKKNLPPKATTTVQGFQCTDGLQTMLDLAGVLDDTHWEHALESALRKKLVTIAELEAALATRRVGNKRIRRVLSVRPKGAPPTESLLETLMVQLIRKDSRLPEPTCQVEIRKAHDRFVARVDLAWPNHGVFIELDGEHHKDQPLYDTSRETDVVATTGWLPGRFTWTEVTQQPKSTVRRLVDLHAATKRRSA